MPCVSQPFHTDLPERWYDCGTIFLDGTDIRELNLTWLRTNIRLVQQEPILFSGTVYENVAFGLFGTEKANLPVTEQRALVEQACKDAYAEEFIEKLPKVSHSHYVLSTTYFAICYAWYCLSNFK